MSNDLLIGVRFAKTMRVTLLVALASLVWTGGCSVRKPPSFTNEQFYDAEGRFDEAAARQAYVKLMEYQLRAITGGKEAQGEVTLKIRQNGRTVRGRAHSVDIIEASAKAYLNAINALIALEVTPEGRAEGV